MSCDKYARMIIKQGSGIPTIPASPDHRDGSWLNTDVYEGEQYLDTDTGIVYTRNGSSIEVVGGGGGNERAIIGSITQAATSAPTLVFGKNNTGAIITPSRISAGEYLLTSDLPIFTVIGVFPIIAKPVNSYNYIARIYRVSDTEIGITTDISGTATDGLLTDDTFIIYLF